MRGIYRRIAILTAACMFGIGAAQAQDYVLQEFVANCMTDIAQFCATEEPGGGHFVRCLKVHASEITKQCRAAVEPTDGPSANSSLEVTVSGISSDVGTFMIMLTDDPAQFPAGRRLIFTPAKPGTFAGVFKNLKPGTYAITAFHDSNRNNLYDRAGTPLEGIGSVNTTAEPRSFSNSSIQVNGDTKVAMTLKYE